jgi:hypothetical protein
MKLSLRQNAEIMRIESEIAHLYGVDNFEDIDRGKVTSRSNGDIVKTLTELAKNKLPDDM